MRAEMLRGWKLGVSLDLHMHSQVYYHKGTPRGRRRCHCDCQHSNPHCVMHMLGGEQKSYKPYNQAINQRHYTRG
jgi:hypothetical protein